MIYDNITTLIFQLNKHIKNIIKTNKISEKKLIFKQITINKIQLLLYIIYI